MKENPTRICELIVGLGDVEFLGVNDEPCGPLALHIRKRERPACGGCGAPVWSKGTSPGIGGSGDLRAPRAPHVVQVALALPGNEKRRHSPALPWAPVLPSPTGHNNPRGTVVSSRAHASAARTASVCRC